MKIDTIPRRMLTTPYPHVSSAGIENDNGDEKGLRKYAAIGWGIIFVFFGIFGSWSFIAPLNGAVVSPGVVKVDGNRKSVQHLEGGIIRDLKVKEGDHVRAGDVLVILEDSRAAAETEALSQRYTVLRATELRLTAELNQTPELLPSADIATRMDDSSVQKIWNGQQQQFTSRREALEGERKVLREKINQLTAQISGSEHQIAAYKSQVSSARQELEDIKPLVDKGLITRPRSLQLDRAISGIDGQIGMATSDIARAKQAIAEQNQRILMLDNDRAAEIAKELRDTQALFLEVAPKLDNARNTLARMDIRAPYAGEVVGLSVFGVGAVIQPGERILDIVPDDDSLIVEARIGVDDISDVHPDMRAEVHLTTYKQRTIPMVHGEIMQVSADRLTDKNTAMPYYAATVRIDKNELAALPQVRLYPGMATQVIIPTTARSAFDYIVGPFAGSFNAAFRQK